MRRFLVSLRGRRLVVAVLVGVGLLLAVARIGATAYTEILWHGQVGYSGVFWTRVAWQWGARLLGGLLVGVLVYLDLKVVSVTLAGIQIKRRFGNLEISEQLPRSYVLWALVGTSALLAVWFGAAVPASLGIQTLILAHGAPWGLAEPFLERDVGFYAFWVPVLGSVITFAQVVVLLLFTLATAGYAATGALRWVKGQVVTQDLARMHLGGLLALFFVLLGLRLWLGRYLLLLDGSSDVQGIFGFTDAQARLPALQTLFVICVATAGVIGWATWRNRGRVLVLSVLASVIAALIIGKGYPAIVQRFQVEPNALERETPYIEQSLRFTRIGFGLDDLDRRRFVYRSDEPVDWEDGAEQFEGLPFWSRGAALATFRQIEARFRYYDFPDVTIDVYPYGSRRAVIALSVREVEALQIEDPNWQNLHLRERYIAGMGAVASLASGRTQEGRPPMLVSGIPPTPTDSVAAAAMALTRAQVYFGTKPQPYAVVNPGPGQFLAPDGSPGVAGVDFPEGIRLSSWLRKLGVAWRFRDANLLFSGEVREDAGFVYRRQVVQRARAIAPFLRFPEAPYPVISDGRIVWLLEAFTGTRAFPLSADHELEALHQVTYARNSIKVTVDAVSGRVDFYRISVEDPLADAYQRAFPGLVRPVEEMPEDLRSHLRYSRELLNLQAQVLLQYHQETARAFHGQQDVWALPTELAEGTTPTPYRPEYGFWRLPGESRARFNLTTVFVPAGRQNLTGVLVGRTTAEGVPELVLFDVPVEDQAPGPRQIEALIEQDPRISQEFSLWRTGGSEVWTGHLHVVPVRRRLLYAEPVFLAAAADAIPEIRRFVVSDGVRVVMTEDLASGLAALAGQEAVTGAATSRALVGEPSAGWPAAALEVLDRAEASLRDGDWAGFGQALQELRELLRSAGSRAGPGR